MRLRLLAALAVGLTAMATAPAMADLTFTVDQTLEHSQSGNGQFSFGPGSYGTSWDISGTVTGTDLLGTGEFLDVSNLDVGTRQTTGTLKLKFTETDLSAGNAAAFLMAFSATGKGVTDKRAFYLDPRNLGRQTVDLGSTNGEISKNLKSALQTLTGLFSITEIITVTSTGKGASHFLSSDDSIGVSVPEPQTLALLGTGILALGAFRRRRKSQ